MHETKQNDLKSLVAEFRQALEDCEDLYVASAQDCARLHPESLNCTKREFIERMVDLHRGLVIKIFIAIAFVDHQWSHEDLVLAQAMFEHLWGRRLDEEQTREALSHFLHQTGLTWDALLNPFDRLETFRERSDQIQTVVMRVANLVAKADGRLAPDEERQLQWIQSEMRRVLDRIPLAAGEPDACAKPIGSQAVQTTVTSKPESKPKAGNFGFGATEA